MKTGEQLKLLSIFHYVVGGLHALFGCFGFLYLFMGLSIILWPESWNSGRQPMPMFFPWIFIVMGSVFILFGVTLGAVTAASGYFIARRKRRIFSIVVGAINCALFPFGTTLGIFDLILLNREDVKSEYLLSGGTSQT